MSDSALSILLETAPISGLLVAPTPGKFSPAPITLHPSPVKSSHFLTATKYSTTYNALQHSARSSYTTWLRPHLESAARADPNFTGRLLALADGVSKMPAVMALPVLSVIRVDYMSNSSERCPKLVEYNTIASSFGCLSTSLAELHGLVGAEPAANSATEKIASCLRSQIKDEGGVAVMVVLEGEANSFDQGMLIKRVLEMGGGMVRRSLAEIDEHAERGEDGYLYLSLESGERKRVDVVYYRAGYDPSNYPTERHWEGRRKLEESMAVKCPDVFGQLFGAKKVQQVLCIEDERARLGAPRGSEGVEETWVGMWPLTDFPAVRAMVARGDKGYVLKPQREGGGNNVYGREVLPALDAMEEGEREGYVLMEAISPDVFTNSLIKDGEVKYEGECSAEFGVFGVACYGADGKDLLEGKGGGMGYICR
eukprot:CAMPEP_0182453282 /NCGR_PEP_ID=MMETSP1319-20130603/410_1 /TAXON_ID=172717 /ORGANISM="Bolidomonas pacifica, Strain RCC208" /LENGTH=424 /DNA_ID=CAMNT_0024651197 /DNA_START=44 /DNA_END=1315 /DNA_ORIENTATION=+